MKRLSPFLILIIPLGVCLVWSVFIYNVGISRGYNKATDAFNTIHMAQDSANVEDAYQRGVLTGRSMERSNHMH